MKYTLYEVLEQTAHTKKRFRYTGKMENGYLAYKYWLTFDAEYGVFKDVDRMDLIWPSLAYQKEKAWEIEPEEIYLYGACDDDGKSFTYESPPIKIRGAWWANFYTTKLSKDNLFPKDKYHRFKLVLVEENDKNSK